MCNAHGHSAGCTCGFGGEGHKGRRTDWHNLHPYGLVSSDVCFPTKCQYCGASVFFVRHNGGSVWFDYLGQPWPKHPCYYKEQPNISYREEKNLQAGINNWLNQLTEPLLGVVTEAKQRYRGDKFIVVTTEPNKSCCLQVNVKFDIKEGFLGEMVIFSIKDKKIIRPYLSLESVFSCQWYGEYFPVDLRINLANFKF